MYHIVTLRRERGERESSLIRSLTLSLAPERFAAMYLPTDKAHDGLQEGEEHITEGDLGDVERYLQELDKKRTTGAAEVPPQRWGEWQ